MCVFVCADSQVGSNGIMQVLKIGPMRSNFQDLHNNNNNTQLLSCHVSTDIQFKK